MGVEDSAFSSGRGCYTTARFAAGRIRFGERAVRRLARDARTLGLGEIDEDACLAGMLELGRANFGDAEGVVRLQASRDATGRPHLVGVTRALGPEPDAWRAISPSFPHEGPMPYAGAKVTNHLLFAMARDQAQRAGVDEAVLFDGAGFLIEGARSNLVVVERDGRMATPDLRRGGVAGLAREVLLERVPDLVASDLQRQSLAEARELIAINAVRGARPIIELDGRPIADGRIGPIALWLREILEATD